MAISKTSADFIPLHDSLCHRKGNAHSIAFACDLQYIYAKIMALDSSPYRIYHQSVILFEWDLGSGIWNLRKISTIMYVCMSANSTWQRMIFNNYKSQF